MIEMWDLDMTFAADGTPISGEIVFSHVDDRTNVVRHFAIERIVKHVERMAVRPPIITFPIDPVFAMYAVTGRGIEQHRLKRITAQDLIQYPIMLAHMPGVARDVQGEHLIIDGNHRYVAAAMMGWKELHGYELPPALWEEFLVNIPEELNDFQRERLLDQAKNPIDSHIK